MKASLLIISVFLCSLSFSQNDSIAIKKYKNTFFIGHPTNFEMGGINLSAHYTIGFKNKNNKNREVQLGYRINKYTPTGGFLDLNFTGNSQVFYLLYGGRNYFNVYTPNFKPYFNWHYGVSVINFEDGQTNVFGFGNTAPIPDFAIGLYAELGQRFPSARF